MTTDRSSLRRALAAALTAALFIATVLFSVTALTACNKKPKLLFSDDFDSAEVDASKWYVRGTDPQNDQPGELRRGGWWTADSVFTKDGNLVIRTTYDGDNNTFHTGSVDAKQLMTYGYYEARCKLPEAVGMWAAFWIMCEKMGLENPDASVGGAEIDIFESPYYRSGLIQHAVHTGGYGQYHQELFYPFVELSHPEGVESGYETWHTFALDWQPDGYTFYVDGVLTWQQNPDYNKNDVSLTNNVSSVPSYIILSVEVGGENGVPADAPFMGSGNPVEDNPDLANFCEDFLIDYVRVWDRKP